MRRSAPLHRLRRSLLRWAGVLGVALSLLAMHQMSVNRTAAAPTLSMAALAAVGEGSNQPAAHAAPAQYTGTTDVTPVDVTSGGDPAVDDCPGCLEHQLMVLTCLVALALLAMSWLLRGPAPWTGWLPRRWALPARPSTQIAWRPPPLTLVEMSISRT